MTEPSLSTLPTDRDYQVIAQVSEPLTPVQIETELRRLYNAISANQLMLMQIRTEEMDAKIAFEKAHLIATMSPDCPKVGRGDSTVAERNDWIRQQEFAEYEAYERAKKRTRNCRDYQASLEQQCSLVQSMNKSVVATYYASNGQGGR